MREIKQIGKFGHLFTSQAKPIATVEPKEEVVIYTEDAFTGAIRCEADLPAKSLPRQLNPQTGPIFIKGAEPGDTLAIKMKAIDYDRDFAVSVNIAGFGALVADANTRMLNKPLEERVWIYEYKDGVFVCRTNPKLTYECAPFTGTIATAPPYESISSLTPFNQGGNMDVRDMCPGNTIYLPVEVEGAYFYIGDCHARQGDGEIIGTALEIPAKVTLEFDIIKGKKIKWPRVENEEYIMVVGSARPMEDAARIAYCELIDWMCEDYGWDQLDAYEALTQCGEMYVGNVVDTYYSLVAKVKKKYL